MRAHAAGGGTGSSRKPLNVDSPTPSNPWPGWSGFSLVTLFFLFGAIKQVGVMSDDSASSPPWGRTVLTLLVSAATLLTLDLIFLGLVASSFYAEQLGNLRAPTVNWFAALVFYALYLGATFRHAIRSADSASDAARRGAALGTIAYGTYELTNWAVIRDWPAMLVPVDLLWGIVLTSVVATAGHWTYSRRRRGVAQ